FSITVTQRIREFALVRALGATRRQVLFSVLAEATTIGVLGSAAGIGGGVLAAGAIPKLFTQVGPGLPPTSPVPPPPTILPALALARPPPPHDPRWRRGRRPGHRRRGAAAGSARHAGRAARVTARRRGARRPRRFRSDVAGDPLLATGDQWAARGVHQLRHGD